MTELKVLMICTDRNLFIEGSTVRQRILDIYGKVAQELHIVVYAKSSLGLKPAQISPNVWIYPTNSISRWLYINDGAKMGKKIVKNNGFVRGRSLITTQDPFECGLAGLKVKKKWRLPLEIQMHIDPTFRDGFEGFLDRVRKVIGKKTIKQADSIRAVGNFMRERLETGGLLKGQYLYVLPVYIDKDAIKEGVATFDVHARFGWQFIILMVARLTEQKNLPFALNVFKLLLSRYPSAGLLIVGAGKDENKLKDAAKELGISSHVSFEGWQNDLTSYYKTSNIFLQTSIFEGYGMALVEAGLSGLPVVTTPVGIALDLENDKDAYVCPSGNTEYFTDAISDLIENNQKRENLKLNLKHALEAKLPSIEDYKKIITESWEEVSRRVRA